MATKSAQKNHYDWLTKRTSRAVSNMFLWDENPRLNPDEDYSSINDFGEEMTAEPADRADLLELARGIADDGFIPADPVVLWQSPTNKRYYVAEGNRRVLVLKLLTTPTKAPRVVRAAFQRLAKKILPGQLDKIPVAIAPTFEDAEWYISQRNSMSSTQRRWTSEQQRRWVSNLYTRYGGNIEKIKKKIDIEEAELKQIIRLLKFKSIVRDLDTRLDSDVFAKAVSHRFPITTLERFVSNSEVRKSWGISFVDFEVEFTSERNSFLDAYAELIRRMFMPKGHTERIDSRSMGTRDDILRILASLPTVASRDKPGSADRDDNDSHGDSVTGNDGDTAISKEGGASNGPSAEDSSKPSQSGGTHPSAENQNGGSGESGNGNPTSSPSTTPGTPQGNAGPSRPAPATTIDGPKRKYLVDPTLTIDSKIYRINGIFEELQKMPVRQYKNAVAASLRIFLDLTLLEFLKKNRWLNELQTLHGGLQMRKIQLKDRLQFVKGKIADQKVKNVIGQLIKNDTPYCLDILNGYQHNNDPHFLEPEYLNGFWSFLMPLLSTFVPIT